MNSDNSTISSINPHSALTGEILRCALAVHTALGPGLLESAYEACLVYELRKSRLKAETQLALPIRYGDILIDAGYRIDILVSDSVIVELKSVETVLAVHKAQLLSYLRLSGKHIGLLLNFNVPHLREGITRIVNKL
jgi:GxxExxY protein